MMFVSAFLKQNIFLFLIWYFYLKVSCINISYPTVSSVIINCVHNKNVNVNNEKNRSNISSWLWASQLTIIVNEIPICMYACICVINVFFKYYKDKMITFRFHTNAIWTIWTYKLLNYLCIMPEQ